MLGLGMTEDCQHLYTLHAVNSHQQIEQENLFVIGYGTKGLTRHGCVYILCIFVVFAVLDMNDNPPKFEQPSYTCFLSEHAQRGQFVTLVTASDPDYVDHERLVYTIVGGNEQQTFSIDHTTGNICLKLYHVTS
jgi:Na+-transporting methylmalonyl-CoA/oxaloacetate decarboxylase beta subunit